MVEVQSDGVGPGRRVQAVVNAAKVLRTVCSADRPLGISEVARATGLSKGSVHSLFATLRAEGLLYQDSRSLKYLPGWGLLELGASVVASNAALSVASSCLADLAQRTGETAFLGILDQGEVLFVDCAESPLPIQLVGRAGKRGPLHATATGKVLLAWQDQSVIAELLRGPLRGYTPSTTTDRARLTEELSEVTAKGFATCWDEHQQDVSGIAVPVRVGNEPPLAAISLAAPSTRLNRETYHLALAELQKAARGVVQELTGRRITT